MTRVARLLEKLGGVGAEIWLEGEALRFRAPAGAIDEELRAELRERDLMIKESDNRIEALEKAVESQLDKVDDLEDELRRANEKVFTLEDKLQHMEAVLAESEANVEGNGAAREKDFEAKRHERLERRLEEKEKELEARERKLRREQAKGGGGGGSSKEVEQLEQDNRMLLKALNREKDEAANLASAKDSEIERLKNKIERMHGGEENLFISPNVSSQEEIVIILARSIGIGQIILV